MGGRSVSFVCQLLVSKSSLVKNSCGFTAVIDRIILRYQ